MNNFRWQHIKGNDGGMEVDYWQLPNVPDYLCIQEEVLPDAIIAAEATFVAHSK